MANTSWVDHFAEPRELGIAANGTTLISFGAKVQRSNGQTPFHVDFVDFEFGGRKSAMGIGFYDSELDLGALS